MGSLTTFISDSSLDWKILKLHSLDKLTASTALIQEDIMISFKWRHFEKEIILMLVRWYCAYSLSYRDIEELAKERGLSADHSTINRWVVQYAPQLEEQFRKSYKRDVK